MDITQNILTVLEWMFGITILSNVTLPIHLRSNIFTPVKFSDPVTITNDK